MDIDLNELRCHRDHINEVMGRISYNPPDEDGCEISYLRIPKGSLFDGKQEGIQEHFRRQKQKAKEQPRLRKGTKNYVRIVRKDGKLLQVDKYVDGSLDVIHVAYYEDGVRYLLPFHENGRFYPTYAYVTHWEDGRVKEEFACQGSQIIRWTFDEMADGALEVLEVNAVPDGREPVLCWEKAVYTPGEEITCQQIEYWDFWMNK